MWQGGRGEYFLHPTVRHQRVQQTCTHQTHHLPSSNGDSAGRVSEKLKYFRLPHQSYHSPHLKHSVIRLKPSPSLSQASNKPQYALKRGPTARLTPGNTWNGRITSQLRIIASTSYGSDSELPNVLPHDQMIWLFLTPSHVPQHLRVQ